ncbi:MAG: cyclic nucleotide-binding domain-containing protein [Treponema succinifaciens]|uniref:Crp/Fnr family transcriptional regulator n=1 Tax=Treponema TaxID=157 RepID=UPI0023F55FFD|nr:MULTISPECIES: cyclic nucleotide-binding domain-containing protein [Treponema]MDD6963342.1 cyclic nucleotide-binding domain-containing protein [Treponema succinifaciens]MDY5118248.1 cyclic nucleotide-binding domain-containing protein [Treponema succinifaciens]
MKLLQLSFVNFKQNSYILVEGTSANDRFFIIQSGRVKCFSEVAIPGTTPEILGPGDFIGVVSCMSGHGQPKNVVSLTPVVAIMVHKSQYPELIMKNTPVAMKIVRSFARDMRIVNDRLTKLTLKNIILDSPESLFSIAEYYEKSGHYNIALYGYYQYLKQCSTGINIENAKRKFIALRQRAKAAYLEPSNEIFREYPADSMIFSECQKGADMFIIQEGSVRISKVVDGNEVTLALLKKGDMFGEMALLENKPRSASAIAHEPCRLMVVNMANFNQMVTTQPQMISKLTMMFAERLWAMHRQLANTQLGDLREKLIDMISLQIEKQKVPFVKGNVYHSGLSLTDVFKLCAIPREQQVEACRQIQYDQNIKIVGGKIDVPDVEELIKQAAFYRKQSSRHAN